MTPETTTSLIGWAAALLISFLGFIALICVAVAFINWAWGPAAKPDPIVHIPVGTPTGFKANGFNRKTGLYLSILVDEKGRVICSPEKE